MKFFVTGVGGQLGHDVMNELLKRGHEGVGSDIQENYSGVADNSAVTKAPYIALDITDNIGLEEDTRIFDGTVNMRFCRKVDHDVRMFFFKQFIHCFSVADICLHKAEIRVIHNRCQCGQIACIGQLVQTDDPVIRILLQHMEYKVTTNKPSAAGNNNIHDLFSSTLIYVSPLYNFFIKISYRAF